MERNQEIHKAKENILNVNSIIEETSDLVHEQG